MVKKTYTGEQSAVCSKENTNYFPIDMEVQVSKRTLLLHSCCGPCSTACIERLLPDYKVTVFFYNPNITDTGEYLKRKAAQISFINEYNLSLPDEDKVNFIEGDYNPEIFLKTTKGFEDAPEGGERCTICFQLRMGQTAKKAADEGFQLFGTTLTVSPHKNYNLISAIGTQLSNVYGVEFLDADFKKKAGYQRSIELSRKYNLYRQNYCGCGYSKY